MAENYCSKCTTKCQPLAIQRLDSELVGLLQYEIDVVLSNAYSMGLIGKQVKNSSKTDPEKATLLLNVITERMKTDPRTFDSFLELLRRSNSLAHLAKCLEDKVREFHQPDFDDGQQQTPSRGSSGSSQAAAISKGNDPPKANLSTDDEGDEECDEQSSGQQYQTRRRRPKKTAPSSHNQSKQKGATCGGQSKLLDDTEYESGVATASEYVPGDNINDDELATAPGLNFAENLQIDGDIQPTQTPGFLPQNQPDSESPSTVVESIIPFAVQEQSMDQTDPLIGECDQQPMPQITHAQVSEQAQNGHGTLIHGTGHADNNEDDWANRARYYVAVGAARESEKDKEIEDLNQEKAKLENELKEKEKKHAEKIKRETEEHQKQVNELKLQLIKKENALNTLQEKRNSEIEEIKKKFHQEKVQQEEKLEEAMSEIESLKKTIQTLSNEVEVRTQKFEELRETTQAKIADLKTKLEAKQKEIEELEEKKATEIGAIEEKFKKEISELENELECEKKAAKVREQLLESQSKVKFLEEEKKYIAEANELKLKIEALGTKLAEEKTRSANKESEHLKAQNKQLTLQKVESEARLKKMEKQIQERDEQLEQCRSEIKRLSLSSTSSSEASLNTGRRNSTSDNSSQLLPVEEVVKFRFQESPDEST